MRNKYVQMSPEDISSDVSKSMEGNKPALIELLEDHIDFESLIPAGFYNAFYLRFGRSHIYHLVCYAIKAGILTDGLGIPRHIEFFDDAFKEKHPDFAAHPNLSFTRPFLEIPPLILTIPISCSKWFPELFLPMVLGVLQVPRI